MRGAYVRVMPGTPATYALPCLQECSFFIEVRSMDHPCSSRPRHAVFSSSALCSLRPSDICRCFLYPSMPLYGLAVYRGGQYG